VRSVELTVRLQQWVVPELHEPDQIAGHAVSARAVTDGREADLRRSRV